MKDKYKIPKTEKELTDLLKDLAKGKKTIEDLRVDSETYSVMLDLTGDGKKRIGTDEEELQRLKDLRSGRLIEVTLNLQ